MNCALSDKQQRQLLAKVYKDLQGIAESDKDFVVNDYVVSMHDNVLKATNDQGLALMYAQLTPEFVNLALTGRKDLVKNLRGKGLSRDALEDTIELFEDFDEVQKIVAPVLDQESAEDLVESVTMDEQAPAEPEPLTSTEVTEETAAAVEFTFKPETALSVTGQQAVKKDGSWTGVKNPEEDFYYNFYQVFADAMKAQGGDPADLVINGHKGFKLKIVRKNQIAIKDAKPYEQRLVQGQETRNDGSVIPPQEGQNLYFGGIGAVVTDNDGKILKFDKDYNVVAEGLPIYHNLRNIKKEGQTYVAPGLYAGSSLQSPEELAAKMFTPTKEAPSFSALASVNPEEYKRYIKKATDTRQAQLKMLYEIRQYLRKHKNNEIDADIAGVSRGVLNIRKQLNTPIDSIDWANSDINFNVKVADKDNQELGERKGGVYVAIPGHRSIPIQRNNFTDKEINNILSLLFDDVSQVKNKRNVKIPTATKKRLIETLVLTNSSTIQVIDDAGILKVLFKGKSVNTTVPAEVAQAKKDIAELLNTKHKRRDGTATQYNTRAGKFRFKKPSVGNVVEEFNIEDGILTITPVTFEDHVRKNATLEAGGNEQNQIIFLNGYFTFDVPYSERKKMDPTLSPDVTLPPAPTIDIKDGVSEVFKTNPELVNVGTQQQYSQYIDAIFPNSKVDDILYHGTPEGFEQFDINKAGLHTKQSTKGIYFTDSKITAEFYAEGDIDFDQFESLEEYEAVKTAKVIPVILNAHNLKITNEIQGQKKQGDVILRTKTRFSDVGLLQEEDLAHQYVVFETSQIHILGSKQDLESFKSFRDKYLGEVLISALKVNTGNIDTVDQEVKPAEKVKEFKKAKPGKGKISRGRDLYMDRVLTMNSSPKDIEAAKKWFENSPLSKYIGYEELFNVVNSNAWAQFVDGGIKLYAGADHTALYHEAFHGFTQHFLSKEEKLKLYKEVSKVAAGKKAIKAWATKSGVDQSKLSEYDKYLAIEELLAEDFRGYMMSDGKKVLKGKPARNSFFRRLMNFLKRLFGRISQADVTTDRTLSNVHDLYKQLRVGKINNYSPSEKNMLFTDSALYKTITPVEGETTQISDQDAMLLVESVDSIISTIIDEENTLNGDTRFTSAVFNNPEIFLPEIYDSVKDALIDRRTEFIDQAEETEGVEKEDLLRKVNLLTDALTNYGNSAAGLIAFHLEKSPFLSEQTKEINKEAFEKTRSDVDATRFDKAGNDLSMMDMASNQVLYLVKSLREYDENKQPIENGLGFDKLADYRISWRKLINILSDSNTSPREIQEAFQKEAPSSPWLYDLIDKLGAVDTAHDSVFDLWTNFWQAFHLANWGLYQVSVNEINEKSKVAGIPDTQSYEVLVGYASAVFRQVERDFRSYFKQSNNQEFIIDTKRIGNILDYKVLEKYRNKLEGKEFEFLADIGIPLTNVKAIREGLEDVRVDFIFEKLDRLRMKNTVITDVIATLKDEQVFMDELPNGQVFKTSIASETSNINKMLNLQARHSGLYANTAVSTADGNTKYEQTQMSTLSVFQDAINNSESFQELIAMPHMSHLSYDNNPAIVASSMMKSLFEFSPVTNTFGKRISNVKLLIDDLSGTQTIIDSSHADLSYSTSTSKADRYTRLLQDIYSSLLGGRFSTMVHADKSTTLSVRVSELNSGSQSENSMLYVDPASFLTEGAQVNLAVENAYDLLLPFLDAELTRIEKIRRHQEDPFLPNIPGYTVKDKKGNITGLGLSMFDDVFKNSAEAILEAGSVENFSAELHDQLLAELTHYFKWSTDNTRKALDRMMFVDPTITSTLESQAGRKLNKVEAENLILSAYTVNTFIHNIESMSILYGDLAQYNMLKEEFHKRNAGIASTGRMFRTDQDAIQFVNDVLGRPYREKVIGDAGQTFDGTLNTAILEENNLPSKMIPEYRKALEEFYADKYMNSKLSAKEKVAAIETAVDRTLGPYMSMDEGDAQGWISFDTYRILAKLEGRWTREQELLFRKIVTNPEDVSISDVAEYFQPRKYQYFGPLATEGVNAMAFHKYSLFPLIPSVIKNQNLDVLHRNMMEQNIDYATFDSGSKVSTIVAEGRTQGDELYSDLENRVVNTDVQYTKNTIYLQYLKDQLDINSHFKGKVIFSTQLRKLIEEGLIEGGVPVDFEGGTPINSRRKSWDKLTEAKKLSTSPMYNLYKNYEDKITKYIEFRKAELRQEVGWSEEELASGKGDLTKLVGFIQKELDRQDLADHEVDFIKVNEDGKLVHDLSISLSANKIERSLNAIVNNRLIRQKVNGEALVQLATTLTEPRNPTKDEEDKYRTNDLRSYRRGADGKTLAMDVKVALQGGFDSLTKILHKDGKPVEVIRTVGTVDADGEVVETKQVDQEATLARLNETIQDKDWRADKANMDLITMVGVRIPVQGLNSMEFMAVWEFLPKEAGNVIIPPSEIVAKSGSDFDIDKLTVMMPNINLINGVPTAIKEIENKKTEAENLKRIDAITEELKKERSLKEDKNLNKIAELTREKAGLGSNAIENSLMYGIRDILELPHNFVSLITPNDTSLVMPIAKKLSEKREYSAKDGAFGTTKTVSPTRVLEPAYNIYKHESNAVGKETLGLGAVDNTYNTLFNRVGAYMNPEYRTTQGKPRRSTILMKHNEIEILTGDFKGRTGISLSHLYDVNNENKVADVINQLMNGWVDVAKDAWIFDIQGNKQVTPVLMFLLQSGVSLDSAVYFVSNPLVKAYVKEQKMATSAFAKALKEDPADPTFYRGKARYKVVSALGRHDLLDHEKARIISHALYDTTIKETKGKDFTAMAESIADQSFDTAVKDKDATAAFFHYMELEDLAKGLRDVKMRLNYDTTKSTTLFDAKKKEADLALLLQDSKFPNEVIHKILDESPISSFRVAPFQLQLWGPLFSLRNDTAVNDFLVSRLSDMTQNKKMQKVYGTSERYVEEFKNDFIVKIFTDAIKSFDINSDTYKGLTVDSTAAVEKVEHLNRGAAVIRDEKTGEMTVYIDEEIMDLQFDRKIFAANTKHGSMVDKAADKMYSYDKLGLAKVPVAAFTYNIENRKSEYQRFVIEREYLRAMNPFAEMSDTHYFQYRAQDNLKKMVKVANQSKEVFEKHVMKATYEEILRDRALNNILNYWKMFMSDRTIADELFEIREINPSLEADYNIVNDLIISEGSRVDKIDSQKRVVGSSFTNLALRNNRVDKDSMDVYYQNMLALADSNATSIPITEGSTNQDYIENERIAQFFSNLPLVAFLQSGLNTTDSLSMVRVMPTDKITDLIESVSSDVKKVLSDPVLSDELLYSYYGKFNIQNRPANISVRRRLKNYVTDEGITTPNRRILNTTLDPDHAIPVIASDEHFTKMVNGEVTGITAAFDASIKQGELVELHRKYEDEETGVPYTRSVIVEVTAGSIPLDFISPETWAETEDATVSHYNNLVNKEGYKQFRFKVVDAEAIYDKEDTSIIEIDVENKIQLESLIRNNPSVIFVLEGGLNPTSTGYYAEGVGRVDTLENVMPITLRNSISGTKVSLWNSSNTAANIAAVKESLDQLEDLFNQDGGVKLAFLSRSEGYGAYLLDPIEPGSSTLRDIETFKYLTTELYKRFGYKNRHSKLVTDVKDLMQEKQGITEFQLEIPSSELGEAIERLTCKL